MVLWYNCRLYAGILETQEELIFQFELQRPGAGGGLVKAQGNKIGEISLAQERGRVNIFYFIQPFQLIKHSPPISHLRREIFIQSIHLNGNPIQIYLREVSRIIFDRIAPHAQLKLT